MAKVILAAQLKSFRFYDPEANINRKFIVFDQKILEEVLPGSIPVVRKARPLAITNSDRDGFDYYFIHDQQLVRLERFRTRLYPELSGMLTVEEKEQHLNPNNPSDAMRYIQLYNKKQSARNWMAVRY
jgi:hypothetical protein